MYSRAGSRKTHQHGCTKHSITINKGTMNHIKSPDNSDSGIEREIIAKGLTAPRVTIVAVEDNIVAEHYFTARQGAEAESGGGGTYHLGLGLLTFCVLVLRNGFPITGESCCASPKNFDAVIGRRIARENAVQKIWPLMGYQLKEQLLQCTQPPVAPA